MQLIVRALAQRRSSDAARHRPRPRNARVIIGAAAAAVEAAAEDDGPPRSGGGSDEAAAAAEGATVGAAAAATASSCAFFAALLMSSSACAEGERGKVHGRRREGIVDGIKGQARASPTTTTIALSPLLSPSAN